MYAANAQAESVVMYARCDSAWAEVVSDSVAQSYIRDTTLSWEIDIQRDVNTGDVNLDGNPTLADIIFLVNMILKDGPQPQSPFRLQAYQVRLSDSTHRMVVTFIDRED